VSRLFPDAGMRHAPDGTPLRRAAPRRLTGLVMVVGVLLAAACFSVAVIAELLGRAGPAASMTDPNAVLAGLENGWPWAFASLGTYVVILTPAVALLATAVEYAVIRDRRTVLLAGTVLLVLVASVVVGILR
jgi:uncharacterized membrane protein